MTECPRCGAPIEGLPSDGFFECTYCRAKVPAHAPAPAPAPAPTPAPALRVRPGAAPRTAPAKGKPACLAVVVAVLVAGLGVSFLVFSGSGTGGGVASTVLGPRVVSFTGHVCFQRVNDDQAEDILGEAYAGDDGNRIFAIDGLTGSTLWATEARMESEWHAYCGDAQTMVLSTPDFRLVGVDVRTGSTKWDQRFSDVVEMVRPSPTQPCGVAQLNGGQLVPFDLNTGATLPACDDAPSLPARRHDQEEARQALWAGATGGGLALNLGMRQEGTPTLVATATDSAGVTRWTTPMPAVGLGHGDTSGFAGFNSEQFFVVGRGLGNDRIVLFTLEASTGRILSTAEETEDHRDASSLRDIRMANGLLYINFFATTVAYNPRTFEEVWSIGW